LKTDQLTVSLVASAKSTRTSNATVKELLAGIRGGKWRGQVEAVRTEYAKAVEAGRDPKEAVATLKQALPGVLWSGQFSTRAKTVHLGEKLVRHSGILCADLDGLGAGLPEVRSKLTASRCLQAVFGSPTLTGLKALFRVPADAEKHKSSFSNVRAHVKELTGRDIDEACSDVTRLCFVSYDPDLWINPAEPEQLGECTQSPKNTTAQERNATNPQTVVALEPCGIAALPLCRLVSTTEQAIALALPREKHGNHRLLYKLAGAIWAYEETAKTEVADEELRDIFRQWHAQAKQFLKENQPEDEYWMEFMDAWKNIDHPLMENEVDVAWRKAQAAPTPPEAKAAGLTSPNLCRLVGLCRELQILRGDKPFHLSPYNVQQLFGQNSHSTAAKWLGGLCAVKILALVERGDFPKRKAASYRFNFSTIQ
jgi:hypothetical protein